MKTQKAIINGHVIFIMHIINPTSLMDDLDIQIPTKLDKEVVKYLGITEYVVYLWIDKDLPFLGGHRIIVCNANEGYIYTITDEKEAAQ